MAGITQTVPNYIQGISQQPDELMLPGQVKDALNVLPNITKGLEKRPGSEFLKTLTLCENVLEEGKYFVIDQDDKYIGRISKTGKLQVWDLNGNECEVLQDTRLDGKSIYEDLPLSPEFYEYKLQAINITNGGSGYTSTPTVTITSIANGLKAYTHNGGAHASRTAGTYNNVATERVHTGAPTGADGAKFNVIVDSNGVPQITMVSRGTGYAVDHTFIINDSVLGGGGASNILFGVTEVVGVDATVDSVTIESGVITKIKLATNGSGYTTAPTITISGGGGSGATATASVGSIPYLQHSNSDSIQALTINDYTFFTNRERGTQLSSRVRDTLIDDSILSGDGVELVAQTGGGKHWIDYQDNVRPYEAFIELKSVAYNKQYALNFHQPGGITQDIHVATKLSAKWLGTDQTYKTRSDHPNSYIYYKEGGGLPSDTDEKKQTKEVDWAIPSPQGKGIFEFVAYVQNNPDWGKESKKTKDGTCKFTSRKIFTINPTGKTVYNHEEGDREKYGEILLTPTANRSLDTGGNNYKPHPHTRGNQNNLRFELENRGTPHVVQKGKDAHDASYECMYQLDITLMHGGEGWRTGDWFIVVMEGTNYLITVEDHETISTPASIAAVRPAPTSAQGDSIIAADQILDSVIAEFDRRANLKDETNTPKISGPGWPWTVRKIGNGLYIRFYDTSHIDGLLSGLTSVPFTVTAPNKNLFNILTSEVNDVGDLPSQCRHGYVVKVLNSNSEKDDYYLQFKSNTAPEDGNGVWEECPKPGIKKYFAADTMPHQLVQSGKGSSAKFYLEPITWEPRLVGDDVTNPVPSFSKNHAIQNIAFYRNRLALLSNDSVILSQAGDYFNFWAKTGMTISPADCIDVSVSSTTPATLLDAIAVQRGLLMFSKEQQFMLTTDNDVLAPDTAKVANISTYSYNSLVKPFSLGTSVGFTNNNNTNTRFMEMTRIAVGQPPDILEQSKLIQSLLPPTIDTVAESKEQGLALFGTSDASDIVYGYKWFNSGEKRLLSSWFKWQLHGNVIYHAIIDDVYYAVIRTDDFSVQLEKIDIKNQPKITTVSGDYMIHLDNMTLVTGMSYSSSTKKTTITIPDNFTVTGAKRFAIFATAGTMAGQTEYPELTTGSTTTVSGDWSTSEVYAGYIYKMKVQFPQNFFKQAEGENVRSDTRGSTIVHRVNLNFGSIGYFQTRLERKCRPDWIQDYEMAGNCNFQSNCFGILPNARETIPIYSRNEDYRLYLESNHTSPCTLHSSSWEGDYNQKYYSKV